MIRASLVGLALLLVSSVPPAAADDAPIPKPEHPRPDAMRPFWANLNGPWEFRFDAAGSRASTTAGKSPTHRVTTARSWSRSPGRASSRASIRPKGAPKVGWYRRRFRVPAELPRRSAGLAALRRGRLAGRRLGQRPEGRRARGRLHALRSRHLRCGQARRREYRRRPGVRPDRSRPADGQAGRLVHPQLGNLADGLARGEAEGVHRATSASSRQSSRLGHVQSSRP